MTRKATPRSTRRLSDLARHVVYPTGIVSTGWNRIEKTARSFGLVFDPWQRDVGKLAFAKRDDGQYAASIGGIVWSWPRQIGKTFVLGGAIFALCKLHPGLTILWTAHQLKTSNETFVAMQGYACRPLIKRFVKRVTRGSGDKAIYFTNGSRILFGAREQGFGLGFTKVDVLVLDEAQRMTERSMDDMVPATNQSENPLVFLLGTPPRPTDPGDVFSARRKEALSGEASDMLYIEFSADDDHDPNGDIDWSQVAKANPSFPSRTPKTAIQRMFKLLGAASFKREGLGIWDSTTADMPYSLDLWNQAISIPPQSGNVAYGVKFSTDGYRVALAAALRSGDSVFCEVIGVDDADRSGIVAWLVERWRTCDCIVVDGKAGAGDLVSQLLAAGVRKSRIVVPTVDEVITAHAGLRTALATPGSFSHSGQPGLDKSVAIAGRRKIGRNGGWGIEPIEPDGDVLPLEAVILARFAAVTDRVKHIDRTAPRGRKATVA